MKDNILKITVFIMIFLSSLVSVQFGGVSLNKIGIIPFYLYIIYTEIICNKTKTLKIPKCIYVYLIFLFFTFFSAFLAIINPILDYPELKNNQINYIIQVIGLYIPMIIILINSSNREKYKDTFFETLVIVVRIHAIFIICQFIIYTLFKVNISELIYNGLFNGLTDNKWTTHIYGSSILLRASGLNYDPAFASYLLICGFAFEKNKKFKYIYILCTLLAQSRTGFISIVFLYLYEALFIDKFKIDAKLYFKLLFVICMAICLINIPQIKLYLSEIIDRIFEVFSNDKNISTLRHSSYPFLAVKALFGLKSVTRFLFGVGPRASGLGLIYYKDSLSGLLEFSPNMLSSVWSIECDFADVLLGCGFVGFLLYYFQVIKFIKSSNLEVKKFGITFFILSFMYNYNLLTINVIIFIFLIILSYSTDKEET